MENNKKTIKDKKLQNIRDHNIEFKLGYSNSDECYYLMVFIDTNLEPAVRPRRRGKGSNIFMYDSLQSYKKHILKKYNEWYNTLKPKQKKILPHDGPIYCVIEYSKKPIKGDSLLDKFIKILYNLPVLKKPDNDNIEKTAWDIFNGLVYKDDNQIYKNTTEKLYGERNYTKIIFYLKNNSLDNIKESYFKNKRLNKESSEYVKSLYTDEEDE